VTSSHPDPAVEPPATGSGPDPACFAPPVTLVLLVQPRRFGCALIAERGGQRVRLGRYRTRSAASQAAEELAEIVGPMCRATPTHGFLIRIEQTGD
jgi:hypothetical protein